MPDPPLHLCMPSPTCGTPLMQFLTPLCTLLDLHCTSHIPSHARAASLSCAMPLVHPLASSPTLPHTPSFLTLPESCKLLPASLLSLVMRSWQEVALPKDQGIQLMMKARTAWIVTAKQCCSALPSHSLAMEILNPILL